MGEISAYCSPTLFERGGKKIIAYRTDLTLFGVDAADGEVLWKYDCEEFMKPAKPEHVHANSPLVHDGHLHRLGHSPAPEGTPRSSVPFALLVEDLTQIVAVARKPGGARLKQQHQDHGDRQKPPRVEGQALQGTELDPSGRHLSPGRSCGCRSHRHRLSASALQALFAHQRAHPSVEIVGVDELELRDLFETPDGFLIQCEIGGAQVVLELFQGARAEDG